MSYLFNCLGCGWNTLQISIIECILNKINTFWFGRNRIIMQSLPDSFITDHHGGRGFCTVNYTSRKVLNPDGINQKEQCLNCITFPWTYEKLCTVKENHIGLEKYTQTDILLLKYKYIFSNIFVLVFINNWKHKLLEIFYMLKLCIF